MAKTNWRTIYNEPFKKTTEGVFTAHKNGFQNLTAYMIVLIKEDNTCQIVNEIEDMRTVPRRGFSILWLFCAIHNTVPEIHKERFKKMTLIWEGLFLS